MRAERAIGAGAVAGDVEAGEEDLGSAASREASSSHRRVSSALRRAHVSSDRLRIWAVEAIGFPLWNCREFSVYEHAMHGLWLRGRLGGAA